MGAVTCAKNSAVPAIVKASHEPQPGERSNLEQRPRSSPTPADAVMNENRPLRQSPIANPVQSVNQASVVAVATSDHPRPAAHAPPAIISKSRIEQVNNPTL